MSISCKCHLIFITCYSMKEEGFISSLLPFYCIRRFSINNTYIELHYRAALKLHTSIPFFFRVEIGSPCVTHLRTSLCTHSNLLMRAIASSFVIFLFIALYIIELSATKVWIKFYLSKLCYAIRHDNSNDKLLPLLCYVSAIHSKSYKVCDPCPLLPLWLSLR